MIVIPKKGYKLNFACILTTGRTGSDFLQGCLDGIPGIITFSGEIPFYKFINDPNTKKILNNNNYNKLILLFIKKHHNLFYKDNLENKKISLKIQKFKKIFLQLSKNKNLNRKTFLENLYLSYHLTLNRNILKKNIIVHHSHNVTETEMFLKDFKNAKILVTIRNPMQNLKSGIDNWIRYDKNKKNFEHFFFYVRRIREDLNFAIRKKRFLCIKLEEMNLNKTKRNILKFLNIGYSKLINISTFAGKPWKSDKISNFKVRDGKFNKSVLQENWKDFYSAKDLLILNFLYYKYSKFGYKIRQLSISQKVCLPFLFFFPLKFEQKMLKDIVLQPSLSIFIKNIYYYIRKILYFFKIYLTNIIAYE